MGEAVDKTTAKSHELHVRYVSARLIRLFPSAEKHISLSSEHTNCKIIQTTTISIDFSKQIFKMQIKKDTVWVHNYNTRAFDFHLIGCELKRS